MSTSQYFLKHKPFFEFGRNLTIFQKTSETLFGNESFSKTALKLHNAMKLSTGTKEFHDQFEGLFLGHSCQI
jgi:hypothetical protein